jgi:DNA-binding NarL/FixJ family response regulator
MYSDVLYARRALNAGANGFLVKSAPLKDILAAIHKVLGGERYLPADLEGKTEFLVEPDLDALTKREFEVLHYLAEGLTNREIASELGVNIKTIDTHRSNVLKKLGLRNNAELTRLAIARGLVDA